MENKSEEKFILMQAKIEEEKRDESRYESHYRNPQSFHNIRDGSD